MQNLWSRVAQTKCNCKCPSCVFTKAAVARRAATSGRGHFIKPVLQSATFTYSAILAGAVVVDGGIKQHRRQRLDTDLAEAKQRLHTQASVQAEHDALSNEGLKWPKYDSVGQSLAREVQEPGSRREPAVDKQIDVEILDGISWLDTQEYDVREGRRPAWPPNFGPNVNTRNMSPLSLWASNAAAEDAASKPWTHRKLRTLELAVGYFILETLIKHGLYADGPAKDQEVPASLERWKSMTHYQLVGTARSLQMAMFEVKQAKLEDWEGVYKRQIGFIPQLNRGMPCYEQDPEGNFRNVQRQLNNSLWTAMTEALDQTDPNLHRELAAKICHDLLTSGAPPTHKTINLLLVGFTKLNDAASAEEIRRLMSFAHVRVNERTCVAVLNHYTLSSNAKGFTTFIHKMRGHAGGLMLARPELEINRDNSRTLMIKPDAESRKVVQKVAPTPMVLNAIIAGLLKFVGFDTSLRLVNDLQREGWGLDKDGLELFLRDCLKARDFRNGSLIWEQMRKLGPLGRADADRCATMLRLCLDCAKETEFRTIFEEVKYTVAHPDALKLMITHRTVVSGSRASPSSLNKNHAVARQMEKINRGLDASGRPRVHRPPRATAEAAAQPARNEVATSNVGHAPDYGRAPAVDLGLENGESDTRQIQSASVWDDFTSVCESEANDIEEDDTSSWSPSIVEESATDQWDARPSQSAFQIGPWSHYATRKQPVTSELGKRKIGAQEA